MVRFVAERHDFVVGEEIDLIEDSFSEEFLVVGT